MNGGVVELDALTDTDRTCTENDDLLLIGEAGCVLSGVGGVEVGNIRAGVAGINHSEYGEEVVFLSVLEYVKLLALPESCHVLVGEAHLLCRFKGFEVEYVCLKTLFHIDDVHYSVKEEGGNLGYLVNLLNGSAAVEKLCDSEDIVVTEFGDVILELLVGHIVKLALIDVGNAGFERADTLEKALLEVRADAHDLAGSLHLRAELVGCGGKLVEGEAGELGNNVVEVGLERRVGVCNLDLFKSHTYCDLRSNSCDGVARSLGRERRGTGNSRVNLDEIVLGGVGIERELNVASALYLELSDKLDSRVVEHLLVTIGESHYGGYDERVTGVNSDGVDVLHTADGDCVV